MTKNVSSNLLITKVTKKTKNKKLKIQLYTSTTNFYKCRCDVYTHHDIETNSVCMEPIVGHVNVTKYQYNQ